MELYIVTGAYGHLGHEIIKKLSCRGKMVRGLVLPNDSIPETYSSNVTIYKGDVCDKTSLLPLFESIEGKDVYVIHTAGIVSIASKYDEKVHRVNVEGTKNVVDMCRSHNVKKLVHVSSVHAIPEKGSKGMIEEVSHFDPAEVFGLYAKTKAEATQLVLDSAKQGLDATVVHPSGIVGPGDYGHGHLTQLVIDFLSGKLSACVKGGYDFVDVRDVANGIISATHNGKSGECYILSNRYFSVQELIKIISEVSGKRNVRTVLPMWFAKATAPLAELYYKLLHQPPLFTRYSLYTLSSNSKFSHKKADKELNYRTEDMRKTVSDTIEFLINQGRIPARC